MVLPASHGISRVPWYSGAHDVLPSLLTRLLRSVAALSSAVQLPDKNHLCESATPAVRRQPVWPVSRSLAATWEIAFAFFSSAYLDVSVQRVPSTPAI